ncbi:hypothetical protein SAMN05518672_1011456 [Chitinophaga sp. CF118]|uniref:hypothetical protein n=1 Tax=Chitinophaga sp. CF118 TaxID=1884367 RepID=UPI0008E15ECF|nr:hypothetical protein [Chitinophaga sp. CF118]SFD28798.1 hypothetical protein SAMN05518672_1011456 [Chitinophaga sp. CF118]
MTEQQHLETLSDIKRMMERSSRFISLSGLSGIFAGVAALTGAWISYNWLHNYYIDWNTTGRFDVEGFNLLRIKLIVLGFSVMVLALVGGIYFTWRRAKRNHLPIWDVTSRNVLINALIPMCAGGAFIAGLLYNNLEVMVAPACLVFYGLALVNASKYTLSDIRYLGIAEIILGILNLFYLRKGLVFWAVGFGVLHIFYGAIMWWKYERQSLASA